MPRGVVSGDSNGYLQQGSLPDGYFGGSVVWDKAVVDVKIFVGSIAFDGTKFLAVSEGKRIVVLWVEMPDAATGLTDVVMSAGPTCRLPLPTVGATSRFDLGAPMLIGDVDEGLKFEGTDPVSSASAMIAYCEV